MVAHASAGCYINNLKPWEHTLAELRAAGTLDNGEQLPSLADFIDVVLEAGTTRLWLDVKNITIDGKSTEGGREASARACERACEIIEEMGAQNFCEFIVTGNATKISSGSPVTIWQRSLAAAGAVGSNAGWMSFRNPADYISYGYPWANLSTENLYFEGKTVNKNGYSVQKFLDAGLKLSIQCRPGCRHGLLPDLQGQALRHLHELPPQAAGQMELTEPFRILPGTCAGDTAGMISGL